MERKPAKLHGDINFITQTAKLFPIEIYPEFSPQNELMFLLVKTIFFTYKAYHRLAAYCRKE